MNTSKQYFPKYKEYGAVGVNILELGPNCIYVASIINNTNKKLKIFVDDLEGWYSKPLVVNPNSQIELFANDEGHSILSCIKDGDFRAVLEAA